MNTLKISPRIAHKLIWLLPAMALLHPASGASLVEEKFDVLKTRTGTYTNVTVTTKAENYIFVIHANGMTSVKIIDLPIEARRQLGYATPDEPRAAATNEIATVATRGITDLSQSFKDQRNWQPKWLAVKVTSEVLLTLLAILLLVHFAFSYCCNLICTKAGSPGGVLVWIPVLQLFPLLRAAGMSGWWFLAFLVPFLNIVAQIVWSLNIVKARGKDFWVAILLILPITNLFAFLYLAFSNGESQENPAKKFQTRALQVA